MIMARHAAFLWASVLILALAASPLPAAQGSPDSPTQAVSERSSHSPAATTPAGVLPAVQSQASQPPHDPPFDVRPLLDRYRAGKPLPAYSPAAIQRQRGLV